MTAAGDERLQLALDAAGLGSFVWHPAEDRAEPDAWTLALFGLAAGSTLTLSSVIFPADRERYAAAVARALDPAGRGELREDIRIVRPDGAERWLALTGRTAFAGHPPRAVRMSGVVADITDRKMADECQRYLLKLADALRPLADPVAVEVEATRLLGEHLGVSRALYCEVEPDENSIVVRRDYTAAGVPSFAGRFRVGDFGAFWADGYRAGKTMATADARTVPRADPAEFEAAGFRASVGVPVNKGGRLVGILVVHSATPRDWTADEVAQVEETAERTWAAVDRARAEVAVRVSEERFRALAEAVPSVVWTNDGGRIDSFNPHTYAYTGLDPAALTGDGWQGVVHPDDRPAAAARWARALAAGEPYRADYRLRRADGAYRWHLARAVRLPDSDRWVGVATDVDDLRRAVAAVRASESRLRAVAANLPSGAIFVVGPDLRYQLAAGLALGPAGFAVADLEGRAVADVMPPDMVATYEAYYRQALAGGTFRTEHAAHGRHYVTHGAPLRDPGGAVTAALAVSYDITDRVLAEQARRASEERFRTMFDLVPDLLWEGRADGFTDWYNRRWLEYTGQTAAEAAGWGWVAAIHPDDRARSRDTYQRGVTTGTPVRQEHRIRRHDGEYRWFLVKAAPVPAAGTAVRWFGAATDVHDERVAAQAVRQAEEQLRLALQAARMGIWRWDVATGTHLRDANLNRLLGLAAVPSATPLAEFLAHVYPDDHADVVDAFGRTARREAKMSLEFRAVWPDGSVHWLRDQGDVFGVGDGRYLTGGGGRRDRPEGSRNRPQAHPGRAGGAGGRADGRTVRGGAGAGGGGGPAGGGRGRPARPARPADRRPRGGADPHRSGAARLPRPVPDRHGPRAGQPPPPAAGRLARAGRPPAADRAVRPDGPGGPPAGRPVAADRPGRRRAGRGRSDVHRGMVRPHRHPGPVRRPRVRGRQGCPSRPPRPPTGRCRSA